MRITNSMISNGMLLNINRNAFAMNNYYNQLSTGKKIQVPSDDPLRASRALKFRTNVSETEQYMKNVAQGLSWMEVSEAAFLNVNNLMAKIRDLTERGATDTLTYEDRNKIITDIASLVEQIGLEMNVTYAGRYVFSGYRTDQPPILTYDYPEMSYLDIKQSFNPSDVQYTKVYLRDLDPAYSSGVFDVGVVKLAYKDLTQDEIDRMTTMPTDPSNPPNLLPRDNDPNDFANVLGFPITVVSLDDFPNGINPYGQIGNYIRETGELVVSVPDQNGDLPLVQDSFTVTYDKLPKGNNPGDPVGFRKGELNPQIYFQAVDNTPGSPTYSYRFNANGERQHFEFEFSVNTRVRINANAPDILTDKMYADYQAMVELLQYINGTTKDDIVTAFRLQGLEGEELEDAVAIEMQKIQDAAQKRFSDLLGLVDKHISSVSTEHTDMGSRMRRLELIETRLNDDRLSYTKLMSENEDADFAEALMRLSALEAIYQASLKTGAGIMKLTLADYI